MGPTVQLRQLLREEKINSQDAKMTFISTARMDKSSRNDKMGRRSDSL
jgi:hypothetical protein